MTGLRNSVGVLFLNADLFRYALAGRLQSADVWKLFRSAGHFDRGLKIHREKRVPVPAGQQ